MHRNVNSGGGTAARAFAILPLLSAERDVQQAAKGLRMRCEWVREFVCALLPLSEKRVTSRFVWIGVFILWGVFVISVVVQSVWGITLVLEGHLHFGETHLLYRNALRRNTLWRNAQTERN